MVVRIASSGGDKKTKLYSELQKRELVEIPDLPGSEVTR